MVTFKRSRYMRARAIRRYKVVSPRLSKKRKLIASATLSSCLHSRKVNGLNFPHSTQPFFEEHVPRLVFQETFRRSLSPRAKSYSGLDKLSIIPVINLVCQTNLGFTAPSSRRVSHMSSIRFPRGEPRAFLCAIMRLEFICMSTD